MQFVMERLQQKKKRIAENERKTHHKRYEREL